MSSAGRLFEIRMDPDLLNRKILHGYLPLTDTKSILSAEGDYLLRLTDHKGQFICVLSVYHNGTVQTLCVSRKNKMYYFNADHKDSRVAPLLDWHVQTKTPIGIKPIILQNPVPFAPWNLQSSDVIQLRGDIQGCYRMKAYEVIVKIGKQRINAAAVLLTSRQMKTESRKQFMAEARILRELSHPNILQIYGVIVTAWPISMIVEICQINLLFLLQKTKIRKEEKIRYASEAAAALKYLTSKGYVHKDVRAENCLINRNMILKLANLRYAASERCPPFMHKEPLETVPAGWLAPETMLRHIFSKETDVWAFGVLLYEIYEDGDTPFYGLKNMEIRSYVIHSQKRLGISNKAPAKVKKLMARCWEEKPSRRPTFQEIDFTLSSIKKDEL